MNENFRQLTFYPSLPCVYHNCNEKATTAIAYAVSEREWRIVTTCERHTVPVPTRDELPSDAAHQK